jgi:hypothetical protein
MRLETWFAAFSRSGYCGAAEVVDHRKTGFFFWLETYYLH